MYQQGYKYGIDNTVNFTDSDRMRQFVSLIDANLPLRRFKIYTKCSKRSELELLENYFRDI